MLPFKIIPKKLRKSLYEDIKETFFQNVQNNKTSKLHQEMLDLCVLKNLAASDKERLKSLIKQSKNINQSNKLGFTALHLLVTHNHNEFLPPLLAMQVNIEAVTEDGARPLNLAVAYKNHKALQILLDAGAYPDPVDAFGFFPLYTSVLQKDIESVRILVEFGADLHKSGPCGRSPVMLATEMRANAILKVLLA